MTFAREDEKIILDTLYALKDEVKTPEAKYIIETLKTMAGNEFNLLDIKHLPKN